MAYDYLFLFSGQIGTGRHLWDVQAVDTNKIFKVCPLIRAVLQLDHLLRANVE